MKKFKKLIVGFLILLFVAECGAIVGEGITYNKYGFASTNINGRIVCEADNLINFSKWASK
jgi:hypothetical protein